MLGGARCQISFWVPVLSIGLCLLSSFSRVHARQCPDCDAQYWSCSWACYETEGWKPLCAQMVKFTDGDKGPNPENVEVFINQCQAQCYVDAYGDFDRTSGFEPKFDQQTNTTCESVWKTQQALDYDFFSTQAFAYEGLLPPVGALPQWLQDEIKTAQNISESIDPTEMAMIWEECSTCTAQNPSAGISGKAPEPSIPSAATAPAVAEEPVPVSVTIPPVVITPVQPAIAPITTPITVPEIAPVQNVGGVPPTTSNAKTIGWMLGVAITFLAISK